MRIAVVGHSLIHSRQRAFFSEVVRQGHQVLIICPEKWGTLKYSYIQLSVPLGLWTRAYPAIGEPDMYNYSLAGQWESHVEAFHPDVLYIQQELACRITEEAIQLGKKLGRTVALFVWENMKKADSDNLLAQVDLLVAGNDSAVKLHPGAGRYVMLPQVGVDTNHFQARPDVDRTASVTYVGRPVPEKGIDYLRQVWPLAKFTPWVPWRELPWWYSAAKVIVCYSLDTERWREQAMPYTAVEAMSCGCAVVASDAGAIPFWLGGGFAEPCPGVKIVPQHQPKALAQAIGEVLENWQEMGQKGREWVVKHLSSPVIAKRLVEAFSW